MTRATDSPPGRGIGRGMWIITWILAFALLTLFFGQKEAEWINPNTDPASELGVDGTLKVVLQQNRQGHYVATGKINGKAVNFLLDTGATDVAVSSPLAKKLGLKPGRQTQASTANGIVNVYQTRIDELRLGDIVLHNVAASIIPNMDNFVLLGMSALGQLDFSQQGNLLILKQN